MVLRVTTPERAHRGRFAIRADAASLAGGARGAVTLWVVLAPAGELPERLATHDTESPGAVLAAGGRRQVFERTLQIDDP